MIWRNLSDTEKMWIGFEKYMFYTFRACTFVWLLSPVTIVPKETLCRNRSYQLDLTLVTIDLSNKLPILIDKGEWATQREWRYSQRNTGSVFDSWPPRVSLPPCQTICAYVFAWHVLCSFSHEENSFRRVFASFSMMKSAQRVRRKR